MTQRENNGKNLRAALTSIGTAVFLSAGKALVGFFSGSLALLASALDSALDAFISTINYFTIREAAKPPDQEHRFGHGKIEAFAEFCQGLIVGVSGFILIIESVKRIFNPVSVEHGYAGIGVMIFAMAATWFLIGYLEKTAKKTGSLVVKADAAHFRTDLLANFAVIGGLALIACVDLPILDPLLSLAISGTILKTASELVRESFLILTDHEIPKEKREKIIEILNSSPPPVVGWHLMRTRMMGSQIHIDFHLVLNNSVSLIMAHAIGDDIEKRIQRLFPSSVILIHFDPNDDSEGNIKNLENSLGAKITENI